MSAFQTYFVDTFKHRYIDFKGRASRSEFWYFNLFTTLIYMVLYIPIMVSLFSSIETGAPPGTLITVLSGLLSLFGLAIFLPSLGLIARRLHDINKSAWNYLFILIPLIGFILLIVWFATDSQPGTNKWGPNPWGVGVDDAADLLVEE